MASKPVAFLLADLGVTKTHSRPRTSNDNPYSEAQFKTLKYRPDFPDRCPGRPRQCPDRRPHPQPRTVRPQAPRTTRPTHRRLDQQTRPQHKPPDNSMNPWPTYLKNLDTHRSRVGHVHSSSVIQTGVDATGDLAASACHGARRRSAQVPQEGGCPHREPGSSETPTRPPSATLRRYTTGRGPTRAAAWNELMLGHPHRHRRQIEDLPPLHPYLRRVHQIRATASARTRFVPLPLVRVSDQRQRRARMPTRLTAAPAPQRFRRRLGERRVRRRRARRVPSVLPQLSLQLRDLSLQPVNPFSLPHHQRSKLLIGRNTTS